LKTLVVQIRDNAYPLFVGDRALPEAGVLLSSTGFSSAPIVITNETVMRIHGRALFRSLREGFGTPSRIIIGDGERFKNRATLSRIHDGMFEARADRHSWVVAFGGGVVGDIAGFAAATYMRGIRFVNVPTTLLAQVDSAIGGKVGINVPQGKNLVGAFHQPQAVLSDTTVLRSLPQREMAAGLYEVIKCAAIRSEPLLAFLENSVTGVLEHEPCALEHVVLETARIKSLIVAADEREKDIRMLLNFGHTIGHALEAATSYRRFKHGEAVAWGMVAALGVGAEAGLSEPDHCSRIVDLIHRVERLPSLNGISFDRVWSALQRDKKAYSGAVRMVLLRSIGEPEIRSDIEPSCLRRFVRRFLANGGRLG
jgi:3-dehydroquinate synthase